MKKRKKKKERKIKSRNLQGIKTPINKQLAKEKV
jgi:hypothetical protein